MRTRSFLFTLAETSYHFIYEQIRSMSPGPIIILGGHEHQAAYIYPVRINESFKNPFPEMMSEGFDVNVIFANYFKELTLIDFDVQKINGVKKLINVNRTIIKSNKKLKEVQLNEFNNANANKIQAYMVYYIHVLYYVQQLLTDDNKVKYQMLYIVILFKLEYI
ncbi:5'_nucleotidase family protein [Hexamita inflata]|uniref:5' nucleotidase family protein n=1 Tax=Hexamita inflata TaxID=28002 RepID=A0AA86UCI5_9EUKA|nr:5' nucleotidase family protein [Hexamita inflata]